ncbi:MAG: hypothetical protein HOP34_17080, partial [Methylococcaceae bacterium]|nr:hypothetical protein [Methylococcaceae bacterium]
MAAIVGSMNASLRGWTGYFHYRNSSGVLEKGEDACRRMSAQTPDEAAQGQRSRDRPRSIPEPAALCEIWAIQGSDKGCLENSACLGVKNIGKP